jgi:hypothetical protein
MRPRFCNRNPVPVLRPSWRLQAYTAFGRLPFAALPIMLAALVLLLHALGACVSAQQMSLLPAASYRESPGTGSDMPCAARRWPPVRGPGSRPR